MRLTTKGRFAVAAMIDLALREQRGPVALSAIGSRQQISLSYLEQMFGALRRRGLVRSARGPGGGYTLALTTAQITVADIVLAVEEASRPDGRSRLREGESPEGMAGWLWDGLSHCMLDYLRSVTLHSLVLEQGADAVHSDEARRLSTKVVRGVGPKPKPLKVTAPNSVFALGQQPASFFTPPGGRELGGAH